MLPGLQVQNRRYQTPGKSSLGGIELLAGSDQISLVRRIAYRMLRHLPGWIDVEELISDGYFGLVQAAERFDLSKGKSFENFAARRIRGAMVDGLRARDALPRRWRTTRDHVPQFKSLEPEMLCRTQVDRGEIVEWLDHALHTLPRRSRLVLQLYDLERMTMQGVATCLGVTEARVSMLRKRTIGAMRKANQQLEDGIPPAPISDRIR